jgi:hypothetical protein
MPTLALSTITFDQRGCIELDLNLAAEGILNRGRRVIRNQTLDGGVAVEDLGFSVGDLTWLVKVRVTKAQAEVLRYLVATYGEIRAVTKEGIFRAAPDNLDERQAPFVTLRLLVKEKESL